MGIITDKQMQATPTDSDLWLTENGPRGSGRFLGRITPGGDRSFYFRYTLAGGKRDTLSIGSYDPKGRAGLALANARSKAGDWSKLYQSGIKDLRNHFLQVVAEKIHAAEETKKKIEFEARETELQQHRRLTVRQVFERWVATELTPHVGGDGKRTGRKDGGQFVRDQFERRVFPRLGDVAILSVRKVDILNILDKVKAEGKLRTANVLLADLKQMFRFAAEREIIENSPIELINKRKIGGKDVKRTRVLSVAELVDLASKFPNANISQRTKLGILLILATGCRIGELLGAVWGDAKADQRTLQAIVDDQNLKEKSGGVKLGFVDLSERKWYLPTTKNQRDHTIHLSNFAVKVLGELAALREISNYTNAPVAWIFPNRQGNAPVCVKSLGKQLADRQRESGVRLKNRSVAVNSLCLSGGRWTAHDLRRTASTLMSQLGISNDVIDECQNHIKPGMAGIYIQDRREAEQVKAFDALGKKLASLFKKTSRESAAV